MQTQTGNLRVAFRSIRNNHKAMKYKTLDGKIFEADSDIELIQKMRADSRTASVDLKDFMALTSRRCYFQSGHNIRTDTHQIFVKDLVQHGFISQMPEAEQDATINLSYGNLSDPSGITGEDLKDYYDKHPMT